MKLVKTPLFTALLGLCALNGMAQRNCSAMEVLERQKAADPKRAGMLDAIEAHTQEFIANQAANPARTSIAVTIPVVFHVVYNNTAENISDARLQEQLTTLNNDFRKLNADRTKVPAAWTSIASDLEINFCLATRDPNGATTTGITRTSTAATSFSDNDAVKFTAQGGRDAWDRNRYLNIWVCDLSGTLLGYAQFPGGAASTDGVVLDYTYTGTTGASAPFNLGRTGTHEVGHWLNLYHIWGDDQGACTQSDLVSDTPNQGDASSGCFTQGQIVTDGCTSTGQGIMWQNYMDYTDDACMYMFTAGQKARTQALFATGGARVSLLTSNGCGGTTTPSYCTASGGTTYEHISRVQLGSVINNLSGNNSGYGNFTSPAYNVTKGSAYTVTLTPGYAGTAYTEYFKVYVDYNNDLDFIDAGENVYTSAGTTVAVSGSFTIPTTAVTGQVRMRVVMSDNATINPCGSFTYGEVEDYTLNLQNATASCGNPTGLSTSSITSSGATLSWLAVSGAVSYNIQYKTSAATTWTTVTSATNSRVLTGLSAGTTYNWQVQAVCSGASGSYVTGANFATTSATCTDTYEPNESLAAFKTISVNTNVLARICTTTDRDWFRFTTTTTAPKVKINLSTLPADYDVVLYNSAGTQLASSTNGGTTAEQIIYNSATAGATYYVQVYGYNGANSSSTYTLRASTQAANWRMDANGAGAIDEMGAFGELTVFPNPTQGKATVRFEAMQSGELKLSLVDLLGKVVLSDTKTIEAGENHVGFDMAVYPAGIYLVRLELNGESVTRRVEVTR